MAPEQQLPYSNMQNRPQPPLQGSMNVNTVGSSSMSQQKHQQLLMQQQQYHHAQLQQNQNLPQQYNHGEYSAGAGAGAGAPSPAPNYSRTPSFSSQPPSGAPSVPSDPYTVLKVLESLEPAKDQSVKELERFIKKDAENEIQVVNNANHYQKLLKRKRVEIDYYNQILLLRQSKPGTLFEGYSGYGNGWTGNQFRIIYPRERKRNKRTSREVNLSAAQLEEAAETTECLVPVRLDLDTDKCRLHDTFTWNANEKGITVTQFAENLVEDFNFPTGLSVLVASTINEQLSDFHPHAYTDISEPKYASSNMYRDEEMRIIVKLDITVGQHNLIDQFEWDLNCAENSPEEFANVLCREMSLSGEFSTAIAHAIREQQQLYTKSLFLVGHPFDGTPVGDDDIRRGFCQSVTPTDFIRAKSHLKEFSPVLFEINDAELHHQDRDRDRESRRKRRQGRTGRRGGPALPDFKELIRTFRTPVYSSMLPGGVDRNKELLRKQQMELSDGEEEEEFTSKSSLGTPNSGSVPARRGRPAANAAHLAISGMHQQHTPNRVGRPPLNRHLVDSPAPHRHHLHQSSLNAKTTSSPSNTNFQSMQSSSFHNASAVHHQSSHSQDFDQRESYLVKLKVPRLGQFLKQISRHNFAT